MKKEMEKDEILEETYGAKEIRWLSCEKIKEHYITTKY